MNRNDNRCLPPCPKAPRPPPHGAAPAGQAPGPAPGADLSNFLREAMLSQSFADVALCCPGGQKFLAHRLVLSAASPYLQEVLLSHSASGGGECEPITVILAEIEGPELAALLGLVYTGSATVPRPRLDAFLRAAEALRIRLPGRQLCGQEPRPWPDYCREYEAAACRASCCAGPSRRPVANQVPASPWSQIARPLHSPKRQPLVTRSQPEPARASEPPAVQPAEQPAEQPAVLRPRVQISHPVSRLCESAKLNDDNNNEAAGHRCEQCAKTFVTRASLKVHLRMHSGEKPFRCSDCGKQFSQLRNYKYHRSVHEGTREFAASCPECGKYFNDRGYLSSHMKIHRNRKEYGCAECGKSFNQRVAYNMHARIHTGLKPHRCEQCGKAFSRKMLLKQHLRTHSGERPYQCQVCHKAFADRSNMTLHTRLHSGLKPYQCTLCSKAFTKKHHLKTHLNYHTGTKPYSCPNCALSFSQSSNMRTHYKKCLLRPKPTALTSPPDPDPNPSSANK